MSLYDLPHLYSGLLFQIVNILGQIVEKDTLVLEHLDEVVSGSGVILGKVQVLSKFVKWFWFLYEVG
jgi:gamma-glutamylcyclotransferase (GGCT)/AIG2-like uncharacterized protein YtfP